MPPYRLLFNRRQLALTLIVVIVVALCIRLGFWQLDRLQWRRDLNAATAAQLAQPLLQLNTPIESELLRSSSEREVTANGRFDYDYQVILLGQESGLHLVAPFVLDGNRAVLVDRGWIPAAEQQNARQYDEALTQIEGVVLQSQRPPRSATPSNAAPGETIFRIDIDRLQRQIPYELLPIYVLQTAAEESPDRLPFRRPYQVELTEGNHLSYAVQWFTFALIFAGGYILLLRRDMQQSAAEKSTPGEP